MPASSITSEIWRPMTPRLAFGSHSNLFSQQKNGNIFNVSCMSKHNYCGDYFIFISGREVTATRQIVIFITGIQGGAGNMVTIVTNTQNTIQLTSQQRYPLNLEPKPKKLNLDVLKL